MRKRHEIFRIDSMDQAASPSTAILMLYERAAFARNDPILKFIPRLRQPGSMPGGSRGKLDSVPRPNAREINFSDLMPQNVGLTYGFMESNPGRFALSSTPRQTASNFQTRRHSLQGTSSKGWGIYR